MDIIGSPLLIGWGEDSEIHQLLVHPLTLLCLIPFVQLRLLFSVSSNITESIHAPSRASIITAYGRALLWRPHKPSKVMSSLCLYIQLPAKNVSLFVERLLTASLLPGNSGILRILFTAIYFNCLDKVNGTINVCVSQEPRGGNFSTGGLLRYVWHWLVQEGPSLWSQ